MHTDGQKGTIIFEPLRCSRGNEAKTEKRKAESGKAETVRASSRRLYGSFRLFDDEHLDGLAAGHWLKIRPARQLIHYPIHLPFFADFFHGDPVFLLFSQSQNP